MYIITFYSYKGGVGRTMALANVAILLAQRGKRVLVVDFDLEAPSLPNYGFFANTPVERGLVDYISEYRDTGVAPDVSDYIYRCVGEDVVVFILPAGNTSTVTYSRKLASIDWQTLYDQEKGYLFFEDLKQQLHSFDDQGFDYVLIDSRTGHTDVGGICTRQLPDLVVPVFLPTMQNISGLKPIVEEIRAEQSRIRRPVQFAFCASNVPDLDDEQQILAELLDTAAEQLGYDQDKLTTIHHYGSLHVLSHAIFVQDRPNSRLSREYEKLAQSIISHNYEDPAGAPLALLQIQDEIRNGSRSRAVRVRDEVSSKVDQIFSLHLHEPEIAFQVSRIRSAIGDIEGEIAALSAAIESGDGSAKLRALRARAYQAINMTELSVADLRCILRQSNATGAEIATALRMLERTDKDYDEEIEQLLDRSELDLAVLNSIAEVVQRNRRHLGRFASRLTEALTRHHLPEKEVGYARSHLALALIGCRQFEKASQVLVDEFGDAGPELPTLFNLFVARWGDDGDPDLTMAAELASRMSSNEIRRDANFIQCRAVVKVALGDLEASLKDLDLADRIARSQRGRIFSCVSYLYSAVEEFVADNDYLRDELERTGQAPLRIFYGGS
ncbi:MAG: ParA family protein [Parvularcula sp.]|nr:ParA family protein [Parvularcula sp.]